MTPERPSGDVVTRALRPVHEAVSEVLAQLAEWGITARTYFDAGEGPLLRLLPSPGTIVLPAMQELGLPRNLETYPASITIANSHD